MCLFHSVIFNNHSAISGYLQVHFLLWTVTSQWQCQLPQYRKKTDYLMQVSIALMVWKTQQSILSQPNHCVCISPPLTTVSAYHLHLPLCLDTLKQFHEEQQNLIKTDL